MKTKTIFISVLVILMSCVENTNDGIGRETTKTFSSNSSKVGYHNTMTIDYKGTEVIAHRTIEAFDINDPKDNVVFIEANVTTNKVSDNTVEISSKNEDVWFIPFLTAKDPIRLEPGFCWKYFCTCGGYPSNITEGCLALITPTEMGCGEGYCEGICRGWTAKVPCRGNGVGDINYLEMSTGGVIVAAKHVRVIDPENTKRDKGVTFYQTKDGKVMPLEEAKKQGIYEEAPENK